MAERGVEEYISELFSRIPEARVIPKKSVRIAAWEPAPHWCHDNASKFCASEEGYKHIYGWLYADLTEFGYVSFIFHSVVKSPDGKLFDITPSNAVIEYPFLGSNLPDEAYIELIELYKGNSTIDVPV